MVGQKGWGTHGTLEEAIRDYLKSWRGIQPVIPANAPVIPANAPVIPANAPVIPAKAGIYGLWSATPVYQQGQLILR